MDFDQLVYSLKNDPLDTRRYIPDKMAKYGFLRAIPFIGAVLIDHDEAAILRIECAEALGKLGSAEGVVFLRQVLGDGNAELRRTSVWALGQIATAEVLPLLIRVLDDKSFKVRRWAIKSLRHLRSHSIEKAFDNIFENRSIIEEPVLMTEVFRALEVHIPSLQSKDKWVKLASEYLYSDDSNLMTSSLRLLTSNEAYDTVVQLSEQFVLLLDRTEKSSPIMPYLISILGKLGKKNILLAMLDKLGPDDHPNFVVSLMQTFCDDKNILTGFLSSPHELLVLAALQALSRCDGIQEGRLELDPFFKNNDFSIQQAALLIHCLQGGEFQILLDYYLRGKGLGFILKLFYFYPKEGLDILKENAINASKTNRISSVHTLLKLLGKSQGSMRMEIIAILTQVSTTDRVWHLRRDARMGLELLDL